MLSVYLLYYLYIYYITIIYLLYSYYSASFLARVDFETESNPGGSYPISDLYSDITQWWEPPLAPIPTPSTPPKLPVDTIPTIPTFNPLATFFLHFLPWKFPRSRHYSRFHTISSWQSSLPSRWRSTSSSLQNRSPPHTIPTSWKFEDVGSSTV